MAMLTHIVLFALTPEAPPEAEERLIRDALEKLTQIPGVMHLTAGRVLQRDTGFDLALAMQFADAAALEAYRVHPIHQEYVAFLNTAVGKRQAYDFES